jgi:hypothetical protein
MIASYIANVPPQTPPIGVMRVNPVSETSCKSEVSIGSMVAGLSTLPPSMRPQRDTQTGQRQGPRRGFWHCGDVA